MNSQKILSCFTKPNFEKTHIPDSNKSRFPIRESSLLIREGKIRILRDDYLSGGTKQRALRPFLQDCLNEGYFEFVYASPFSGFAQVALSYACQELGLRCRIYAEADPNTSKHTLSMHSATEKASLAGAEVTLVSSLSEAEYLSTQWSIAKEGRCKIPLGLDCDGYRSHLKAAVSQVWNTLVPEIEEAPKRLWVSLGSGTLATTLRTVVPVSTELCCVNVHVLTSTDPRIERVRRLPHTQTFSAKETFSEKCRLSPPISSNCHYDAKVWRFLLEHAEAGDIWWNVAR